MSSKSLRLVLALCAALGGCTGVSVVMEPDSNMVAGDAGVLLGDGAMGEVDAGEDAFVPGDSGPEADAGTLADAGDRADGAVLPDGSTAPDAFVPIDAGPDVRRCHPTAIEDCAMGETCRYVPGIDPRWGWNFICTPNGFRAEYDPCTRDTECNAGLACISGLCRRLCRTDAFGGCSSIQTCVGTYAPMADGTTPYGYCE